MFNLIENLCSIRGISGREKDVRNYIIEEIKDYAAYKIDPLGNLLVFKQGQRRSKNKVMFAAHMDEVGMIVTYITDEGFLKFSTVGGVDTRVFLGRSVVIGDNKVNGVVGLKPIHMLTKADQLNMPEKDELYIDIGAKDKNEAMSMVHLGDAVNFNSDIVYFGDGYLKGRALDDRVGCAIMINMIKSDLLYDTYFAFTVQEEVGTRGAAAATFTLSPDYAIVIETTTAADIPGVEGQKRVCSLGEGAVVGFMDNGTIYDRDLYNLAFSLGERYGIKVQTKTMVAGGNDARAIHKSGKGVKTIAMSLPCRYLHSPSCVIKLSDAEYVKQLARVMGEELCHA